MYARASKKRNIFFFAGVTFRNVFVFALSLRIDSLTEKMNPTSRPRCCRLCANHNIVAPVNGHRGNCPFDNCVCNLCCNIRSRNARDRESRARATNSNDSIVPVVLANSSLQANTRQSVAANRSGKNLLLVTCLCFLLKYQKS